MYTVLKVTSVLMTCLILMGATDTGKAPEISSPTVIKVEPGSGYHPKLAPDGRTIAYTRRNDTDTSIWIGSINGGPAYQLEIGLNGDCAMDWHPDGKTLVFDCYKPGTDGPVVIWTMALNDKAPRLVSEKVRMGSHPVWSPDGSLIAFTSMVNAKTAIHTMGPEGQNIRRLTDTGGEDWHPAWSPDGKSIVFTSDHTGDGEIWMVNVADGKLRRLTDDPAHDDRAVFSPDGKRLAFTSERTGSSEIWIQDLVNGELTQVTDSDAYNTMPCWTPDGKSLIYSDLKNLLVIEVE